jgi:hypothetical protein
MFPEGNFLLSFEVRHLTPALSSKERGSSRRIGSDRQAFEERAALR